MEIPEIPEHIKGKVLEALRQSMINEYAWICSFYKENGGVTIADNHFDDELEVQSGYGFQKHLEKYGFQLDILLTNDGIEIYYTGGSHFLHWNEDLFLSVGTQKIWLCARDYAKIKAE